MMKVRNEKPEIKTETVVKSTEEQIVEKPVEEQIIEQVVESVEEPIVEQPIEEQIVETPEEEQIPEKTVEQFYEEMFDFAKENQYDGGAVYDWILTNARTVREKMNMWGTYVSEITRYNTTIKIKEEDQLKLLKILE